MAGTGSRVGLRGPLQRAAVRRRLRAVAGLVALAAAVTAGQSVAYAQNPACPSAASSTALSCTFAATGAEQTYTVPTGVTTVTVAAVGAHGGFGNNFASGGLGARVVATVPLPAGTPTLHVEVGTAGGNDNGSAAGGFNGGGSTNYGGGGGGASDVRTCSRSDCTDLSVDDTRLVVAGGGGGGGGGRPRCGNTGGRAGDPSTTGPGAGGPGETCPSPGGNGGFGGTGTVGQGGNTGGVAGAGGGGYRGGGAAGNGPSTGGGGGAGSSFWVPSAIRTSMTEDSTGTSQIVITQAAATHTTLSSRPNPSVSGDKVTYTAIVSPTPDGGTVAFADGPVPIAGCEAEPVDADTGDATCLVTYSAPGAHTITAAYSGDDAFIPSTSPPLTQHVAPAPPSPSPSPSPPPSSSSAPTRLHVRVPGVSVFGHAGTLTRCRMSAGRLRSCTVRLVHSGHLLAVGARSAETSALTVRLRLSAYGRRILARRLGGVSVRVRAVASTSGGVRRASGRTLVVLRVERVRTSPGSFVANRPLLTSRGKRFLRGVRGRLIAVQRLRCDGYAATVRPHSRFARSLSRRRGRLICNALRRLAAGAPGVRVTGHGAVRPIASNATERGRATNRRVEVTIVHRT
jgi:hypothetical protein